MCGLVGIVVEGDVAPEIYDALTMLQHRGQTLCIMTCEQGRLLQRKGEGLVRDVFRTRHGACRVVMVSGTSVIRRREAQAKSLPNHFM